MSDCIFCRIVAGDASAFKVAEDAQTLTFMDLFPAAEGHVLVIPKAHADNIFSISASDISAVSVQVRRVALALRQLLSPDGLTVSQANGAAAGQTVAHYHVHLIPRSKGAPMQWHGTEAADAEQLRVLAQSLAEKLQEID